MSTPSLPRLSSRGAAAAGLIVLFLAGLSLTAWSGFRWRSAIEEQTASRLTVLSVLEKRDAANAGKAPADMRTALLGGATRGLAAAELQRIVVDVAVKNGMAMESVQALSPETQDELTAIRIEANMTGSLAGLNAALHAVETRVPLFFVGEAEIKAVDAEGGQAVREPSDRLSIRLVIEAFLAGEGQS